MTDRSIVSRNMPTILFRILLSFSVTACASSVPVDDTDDTADDTADEGGESSDAETDGATQSSDSDAAGEDDSTSDSESESDSYNPYHDPVCGDGIRGRIESCDDGNTESGDGCAKDCRRVGSGWACPDAGGACQLQGICGDGAGSLFETCDDGNTRDDDDCPSNCGVFSNCEDNECDGVCGDGIISPGEQCDDGVNDGGYNECGPDCRVTDYCGDGFIQEPFEVCDDGNRVNDDDCPSSCLAVLTD